jgi:hypothetical protein
MPKLPKIFSKNLKRLLRIKVKDKRTAPIKDAIWLRDRRGLVIIEAKLGLDRSQKIMVIKEILNGNIDYFNRLKNPPIGGF